MDMHSAALPPRQPTINDADRSHPLFPLYQQHRSSCARLMVQALAFDAWKFQHEAELVRVNYAADPRYPAFLGWMRANQGGARKCPAGSSFPRNFIYWTDGGRW